MSESREPDLLEAARRAADALDSLASLYAISEATVLHRAIASEEKRRAAEVLKYRAPCEVCHGTGRNPASDNVNWLPCGECNGTGLEPHGLLVGEKIDLAGADAPWRDRYLAAGKKSP